MGHVDKRSITLSPDLATAVDEAVAAAANMRRRSEVIRDALRDWKEKRDLFGYTLEELRGLVQEGSTAACHRMVRLDDGAQLRRPGAPPVARPNDVSADAGGGSRSRVDGQLYRRAESRSCARLLQHGRKCWRTSSLGDAARHSAEAATSICRICDLCGGLTSTEEYEPPECHASRTARQPQSRAETCLVSCGCGPARRRCPAPPQSPSTIPRPARSRPTA